MICGMLNTKDVRGYLAHFEQAVTSLTGVSIPGEANTLAGTDTAKAAREAGLIAREAADVAQALDDILKQAPQARVLICGSLYLAGAVLRENG